MAAQERGSFSNRLDGCDVRRKNICCIVLNKQHNFGKDRLKALADEVNANIKEFYADPEAGCYNIKRAMEQIGFDDNIGDIMDTLAVHDDLKAKLSRIKK